MAKEKDHSQVVIGYIARGKDRKNAPSVPGGGERALGIQSPEGQVLSMMEFSQEVVL